MSALSDEIKLALAKRALVKVLVRIKENPDVRQHMGVCTSSFEYVSAAYAAIAGADVNKVREGFLPGSSALPHSSVEEIIEAEGL